MSPRLLFSILAVLLVYLSLSLYHGHQVKKLPDLNQGGAADTDSLSAQDREKNWIQVTIEADGLAPDQPQQGNDGVLSGPETPGPARAPVDHGLRVGIQGPPRSSVSEDPVELRSALEREKMKADSLAREKENLLFRIDALESELREMRNRLAARETELQRAAIRSADAEKTVQKLNAALAVEKNNRQHALDAARGTRKELARSKQECGQYLAEIGRLQTLLKETKSRLVSAESENARSRLKAEAMLHYGREQDRLVTPYRQEIELLHARLENMNSSLVQSERQVADLRATEQQLRQQITGLRPDEESFAPMEEIMTDLEPTAAGEQQD